MIPVRDRGIGLTGEMLSEATNRRVDTRRAIRWIVRGMNVALVVAALLGALSLPAGGVAAAEPEAGVAPDPYAVEEPSRFSLRALLDLRVVRGSEVPSWQEGGPGKIRYGGIASGSGFERVTRFAIAQLALQPAYELGAGWRAQAQINWDGDLDENGDTSPDHDPVRIVEGFARRDDGGADDGWSVLVGLRNPPFSLEHTGPARTPLLSLTPAALTSWLWEEGRVLGAEAAWWHREDGGPEVAAFAGAGWGPDQQGILLARRGWVLSDFLSGANSELPLPGGGTTTVFDERDGRPAVYAGASLHDPWQIGSAHVGYWDNLGDLAVAGVWETRFGVGGVALAPAPGLDLTVQMLYGTTTTRGAALASTIRAFYPILSYRWREHRVSFRYDDFAVRDDDGGTATDERGTAYTVAYLFEFRLRHRVAFEYVWVDAERAGAGVPGDDGWQLSYRFRY